MHGSRLLNAGRTPRPPASSVSSTRKRNSRAGPGETCRATVGRARRQPKPGGVAAPQGPRGNRCRTAKLTNRGTAPGGAEDGTPPRKAAPLRGAALRPQQPRTGSAAPPQAATRSRRSPARCGLHFLPRRHLTPLMAPRGPRCRRAHHVTPRPRDLRAARRTPSPAAAVAAVLSSAPPGASSAPAHPPPSRRHPSSSPLPGRG